MLGSAAALTRDAAIVTALYVLRVALTVVSLRRCLRTVHALAGRRSRPRAIELDAARRAARRIDAADRRLALHPGDCLTTSLLLCGWLRWRGAEARFCLGVRTLTGVFESHAWVELDGVVLNDDPDISSLYAPLSIDVAVGAADDPNVLTGGR